MENAYKLWKEREHPSGDQAQELPFEALLPIQGFPIKVVIRKATRWKTPVFRVQINRSRCSTWNINSRFPAVIRAVFHVEHCTPADRATYCFLEAA